MDCIGQKLEIGDWVVASVVGGTFKPVRVIEIRRSHVVIQTQTNSAYLLNKARVVKVTPEQVTWYFLQEKSKNETNV